MRTAPTRNARALLIAAAAALIPLHAAAQPGLPTPNTQNLTATDRQDIGQYVDYYTNRLCGTSIDTTEAARVALLRPFNDPDLTVPFRLEFTQRLVGPLTDIITQQQDIHCLANALAVIGRIADRGSVDPITQSLDAEPLAVRIAAAQAMKSMLVELSLPNVTAAQRRPADTLFTAAERTIRATEDPELIEALAAAVTATPNEPRFRDRGLGIILTAARERAHTALQDEVDIARTSWPEAARLALGEVRSRLVSAPADEQFPQQFLTDAADLAGIGLGLALATLQDADDPVEALTRIQPLAQIAESVADLAVARATGQDIAAPEARNVFLDAIDAQDPAPAEAFIQSMIGRGGMLDSSAFPLEISRYAR